MWFLPVSEMQLNKVIPREIGGESPALPIAKNSDPGLPEEVPGVAVEEVPWGEEPEDAAAGAANDAEDDGDTDESVNGTSLEGHEDLTPEAFEQRVLLCRQAHNVAALVRKHFCRKVTGLCRTATSTAAAVIQPPAPARLTKPHKRVQQAVRPACVRGICSEVGGLLLSASSVVDADTVEFGRPLRLLILLQGSPLMMEAVWTVPRGRKPEMPAVPPGMTALEVKAIQDMMVFFPEARVTRYDRDPRGHHAHDTTKKQHQLLLLTAGLGCLELRDSAQWRGP